MSLTRFSPRRAALACALTATAILTAPARAAELSIPVEEHELENGLRVLIHADDDIPNVVTYLVWKVGSRNEHVGITGIAHFFEHMMFTGGAKYGANFDPTMEAAGGSNNAYTSNDVTVYQNWFPEPALPLILDMEADRMSGMVFDPNVVASEREVVASERRLSMEEPSEVMYEQLMATAYTAHPYRWSVLGWMVDIQNWKQSDLESFFDRNYAPNNVTLIVVGDVDAKDVMKLVREKMGKLPRKPDPRPVHTQEPPQKGERRVEVETEAAGLGRVMMSWHIVETEHPEFAVHEVLEALLFHGDSSRLHRLLVEKEKVCLSAGGGWQGHQFDPSTFAMDLVIRDGRTAAEAEALTYAELARLAKDGPSKEELRKVKNGLKAQFVRRMRTIDGKADLIAETDTFFGGWKHLNRRLERIEAVTAERVREVVQRVFTKSNRTVCTLVRVPATATGPDADPPTDPPHVPDVPHESAGTEAPEAPDDRPVVKRDPVPVPKGVAEVELPEPVAFQLKNGLRVRLLPSSDVPLVTLSARIEGGSREDPEEREGASALLAELLTKGAGERDAAAFQEAVDFVGGTLGASSGSRWLDVSAEFLSDDTELALDLLADVLLRPRLDPAEFEKERGLLVDGIRAAREEPSRLISTYYLGFLLGDHACGRPAGGDEQSLARVTLDDVRALAKRQLAASRTLLAVAGDFDPDKMKAALEARLGGWEAGSRAPALAPPPAPKPGRVLLVDKPDALQTYFRFGHRGIGWGDPRYPARYLANTILGGRFTSRLNTALRIEGGLTYGAGSGFDDAAFGLFNVRSYTATDTSQECMDLALEVYRTFREKGITAEELASARAYIQGQYAPETIETAAQAAGMILSLEAFGLTADVVNGLFPRLDALTLDGVNRTIREIFPAPDELSWVVIGRAELLEPIVARYGKVTTVPLSGPGFVPSDE